MPSRSDPMPPLPAVPMLAAIGLSTMLALAGCISTGHHLTVDEFRFPDGSTSRSEDDVGQGVNHVVRVHLTYPSERNTTILARELNATLESARWTIHDAGPLTNSSRFVDAQRGEEYLSCRMSDAPAADGTSRLECAFGSIQHSYSTP